MDTLLYELTALLTDALGEGGFQVTAILAIGTIILFDMHQRRTNVVTLVLGFSVVPMFTPYATTFLGFEYFTAMNYDLQTDPILINSAVLLIASFSIFMYIGSIIKINFSAMDVGNLPTLNAGMTISLAIIVLVMMLLFLEAETILFTSYATVKAQTGELSSTTQQILNISVALLIMCARGDRAKLFTQIFLIAALVIALLVSRRTVALSIVVLFFLMNPHVRLSVRRYILIIVGMLALLALGEIRAVGFTDFMAGVRADSVLLNYYSMPGGGANIFMSVMGVIHMVGSGVLQFPATMPVMLWPQGIVESQLYEAAGYQYNGGMHLSAVLYWNFGLLGVVLGGLVFGVFLGQLLRHGKLQQSGASKIVDGYLALIIMMFPLLIWYGPYGFVRSIIAFSIIVLLLRLVPSRRFA